MTLLSIVMILVLITDPIGSISSFEDALAHIKGPQRKAIIVREMLFALGVMVFFNFIGEVILDIFKLSETTVRLTSGIILFLGALRILFPPADEEGLASDEGTPFIVPLAIPTIASPALLATIMLFAHIIPGNAIMLSAIGISWLISVTILLSSGLLKRVIGKSGLMACERLMGMVLILLAIQRFMDGIDSFIRNL